MLTGRSMLSRLHSIVAFLCLVCSAFGQTSSTRTIAHLPLTTRSEILARAHSMANHSWVCGATNLRASCSSKYISDWKPGQRVTGIPYSWGGIDGSDALDRKLARGLAAGGHSRYGVLSCTTGVDCSGFVSLCWGLPLTSHAYTTRNLRDIAGKPKYNWFTDMKPGDALVKPGSHVVLFTGYNRDGTINICEASGSASRVVCHMTTWSRLKGFIPLQYKAIDE